MYANSSACGGQELSRHADNYQSDTVSGRYALSFRDNWDELLGVEFATLFVAGSSL